MTDTAQQIEAVSADGQALKLNLICQKVYATQLPNQVSPYTSFESSDDLDQLMDKIKQNNSGLELTFDRITDRQFAIWARQDGKTAFYAISKYLTQDQPTERYLFSASVLRMQETDKQPAAAPQTSIVFPYDLVEPFRELSWGYRCLCRRILSIKALSIDRNLLAKPDRRSAKKEELWKLPSFGIHLIILS